MSLELQTGARPGIGAHRWVTCWMTGCLPFGVAQTSEVVPPSRLLSNRGRFHKGPCHAIWVPRAHSKFQTWNVWCEWAGVGSAIKCWSSAWMRRSAFLSLQVFVYKKHNGTIFFTFPFCIFFTFLWHLHVTGCHNFSSSEDGMETEYFPWGVAGRDFPRIAVYELNTIQWKHLQIAIILCWIFSYIISILQSFLRETQI